MSSPFDARPDPRPRQHPQLYQAYQMWHEFVELRKRHLLRISSIEHGKSNLDADFEAAWVEGTGVDGLITAYKRTMVDFGQAAQPTLWAWLIAIRGLGEGGLAAQLVAQIDDIARFATISKLWRFAGYAVIDGHREYSVSGESSHYNRHLKSLVFLIVEQFIRQQTEVYAPYYYAEKAAIGQSHPQPVCCDCGVPAIPGKRHIKGVAVDVWRCPVNAKHGVRYGPGHLHLMAMRKTGKLFLAHVFCVWREASGLAATTPYVEGILRHEHIIAPPGWHGAA